VAKVAALLTPEDLMQIPGFAQSNPLPPVGPTITPADTQRVHGSPPLNNPEELKAWLGKALDGYTPAEAQKWASDFVNTLPAAQQQTMGDLIMQSVQDNGAAGSRGANGGVTAIDDLLAAANKPYNASNEQSVLARAWDKHSGRPGGTFEPLKGNASEKNAASEAYLRDLLNNPDTTRTNLSRGGFEYRLPNGQGVRFNADGSFNTLLDPRKP
jgi:hypothetical protein